jgi:formylglycine-generating enzyme
MRRLILALSVAVAIGHHDLTAQRPRVPDGFTPIFNGRDLTGWHVSRTTHQGTTPEVSVEDGVLVLKQRPYGQGGLLLTDRRYRDFELYLEAKPDWGCNGGIVFRSTEGGSAYQIELDQANGTGNLFGDMLALSASARATDIEKAWKYDDWNAFRLRVVGEAPRLQLWINDVPMWDVVQPRNDLVAGRTDGMIGLQVHWSSSTAPPVAPCCARSWKPGGAHRFRNIAIRSLNAGPTMVPPSPRLRGEGRDEGQPPPTDITNSLGMPMVLIAPGTLQVGRFEPSCPSPSEPESAEIDPRARWTAADYRHCEAMVRRDRRPGFTATMARPFYIGKYEVTQGEWSRVMGANPSVFQGARVSGDATRHPVDSVTWEEAQQFVRRLNALEKTSAYRLPTELEWEYAARAGASADPTWDEIRELAWEQDLPGATTHPVGTKKANAWGLHDMLGNVWEWVDDIYNERLFADPAPPRRGATHVLKGGGFLADVKNAIYSTHAAGPGDGFDVGFRVVRDVPASDAPPASPSPQPPASQAPSPLAIPNRPNKVFLSGENPYIALRETPEGPLSTASFWRIYWSPVGAGHVCYVTVGEPKAPGSARLALFDNKALFDYLTTDVLGSYNKTYVEWPFTAVGGATFAASGDSIRERRETCRTASHSIELVWRELREPGLVDILPGSRPTNPFGITYLRIPAGSAQIIINGKPVPGASTAPGSFLAFGETWIK